MKLQRVRIDGQSYRVIDDDHGAWVVAADVLALLASIREAVAAERASMRQTNGCVLPGAALDALLSGEGA